MNDAAIIFRSHFEAIESLPEEQRYNALKGLIQYCMDDAVPEDGTSACVLMMAKPVLDKWKGKREAGQKGGKAERKQTGSKTEANGSKPEPKEKEKEKEKVKVKVKEKDIRKDIQKESPAKAEPLLVASQEIVKYLNQKIGTRYSTSSRNTITMIKARMAEGHTVDDFKHVIDVKTAEWKGTEQEKYLRPETLFCAKHFESYLNQTKPPDKIRRVNLFDNNLMHRTGDYAEKNQNNIQELIRRQVGGTG